MDETGIFEYAVLDVESLCEFIEDDLGIGCEAAWDDALSKSGTVIVFGATRKDDRAILDFIKKRRLSRKCRSRRQSTGSQNMRRSDRRTVV